MAINECEGPVYFVEEKSDIKMNEILEGLTIADYVSGYHQSDENKLQTQNTKWKYTNENTMTFASTVSIVSKDFPIFKKYCSCKEPDTVQLWLELKRKIVTQIR